MFTKQTVSQASKENRNDKKERKGKNRQISFIS